MGEKKTQTKMGTYSLLTQDKGIINHYYKSQTVASILNGFSELAWAPSSMQFLGTSIQYPVEIIH